MSEKEKEFKYEDHVYARTKVMDFDEFHKSVKETNGKIETAGEKDQFFGMRKIKGMKMFSAGNPYFYQAVGIKDEDDKEQDPTKDVTPPKEDVQTPDVEPVDVA